IRRSSRRSSTFPVIVVGEVAERGERSDRGDKKQRLPALAGGRRPRSVSSTAPRKRKKCP
ncbi:hypothetical protein, partial [Streptomyces sp. NPDC056730]|uniref:hypothetical protein n=1 Tax=Streptomyces sp. NPDC056730 TaxID=3345929 RepID=UPI0036C5834A